MTVLNISLVNPATELELKKNSRDMQELYRYWKKAIMLNAFHFITQECKPRNQPEPGR